MFPGARLAVFVDGCYWHGCEVHGLRTPKTNSWYWTPKISRNVERDRDTDRRLSEAGWGVIRIWEHDDVNEAAMVVRAAVRSRPS